MTTLPQTAQVRLPRPAGALPALPGTIMGHGPHGAGAAGGMSPGDIWRVLRAHTWLIFTFLIASMIIGYAVNRVLERYASRYTAEGLITIQPATVYNPGTHGNDQVSDFTSLPVEQHTQAMLLMNDSLFTRVLQNPSSPIRNTTWYHRFEIPVKQADGTTKNVLDLAAAKRSLRESFVAIPVENSKVVKVDMTYSIPRDTREIVTAIVQQHLDIQTEIVTNRQLDRSQILTTKRSRDTIHLKELQDTLHEKELELNITGTGSTNSRYSSQDLLLTQLVEQRLAISSAALASKAQFQGVQAQLEKGIDPPYVENAVTHDALVMSYSAQIDAIDVDIKGRFWDLPDSPEVRTLEAKKAVLQAKLEEARSRVRVSSRNEYVGGLQERMETAQRDLDAVEKRIKALQEELGDLNVKMSDYLSLSDDVAHAKEELTDTNRQIDNLNSSITQATNGVQWSMLPTIPDTPSFPRLPLTMTVAIMMGLAVSVGIAFLRELMDTTVRSPRDIARVGNLALLGMVPHEDDDPQSMGVPLPVVIYQAPTSIMAEGFRQVRTRLQHTASLDTTRSILVTSPSPGDGKSVVASNLAAGLALNGRRILLVDANFRRPALDKYFAVDNTVGFSDVLGSIDRFDQAVHKTTVPNLHLMTTGPRPSNPTELLESQLLLDFIERALEEYDHIVFDSGPMLLVSETAALAPRVDGVVTVVRARSNTRGLLQRLHDNLRQLKAEHLGVVLNAVRSQGGGYYGRNIKAYYDYQNGHAN